MVTILLFVVFPGVKVLRFKVNIEVKINQILDYIGHQYALIHNGTFLLPMFTVEYYNLGNDDRLWAIPANDDSAINRYKDQPCPLDYTINLWNRYLKQENDRELEEAKIKDFKAYKIESKTKRFRKLLKRYADWEDKYLCRPIPITETVYFKPVKPCSDPIPPFWK